MSFRVIFLFTTFSLLALSYPGQNPYIMLFSHYKDNFFEEKTIKKFNLASHISNTTPMPSNLISANGVFVVEKDSFNPLYERNSNEKFYPASTTKILTAIVTLKVYSPDDIIKIKNPLQEGQIMGLIDGESITVENLLYGMLVQSGNDAADAIAKNYGYEKFISKMNDEAQRLGMKNSYFENPTGLDSQRQVTTPFDMAVLSRELLKNKLLKKIISTKQITVSDTEYEIFHSLKNVNSLLGLIPGLGGLKTGYTLLAKENLVSYYNHKNKEFIIVVLNSENRFEDTKIIVDWLKNSSTLTYPPIEYVVY